MPPFCLQPTLLNRINVRQASYQEKIPLNLNPHPASNLPRIPQSHGRDRHSQVTPSTKAHVKCSSAPLRLVILQMNGHTGTQQSPSAFLKGWPTSLLWTGGFLILLGVAHSIVQVTYPRDWGSPIGWRKPILFGISTGTTLLSLAWVISKSQPRSHWLPWTLAGSSLIEVLIITIQTWRSVPAHFNQGAPIDRALGFVVDLLLILLSIAVFVLWLRTLKGTVVAPDYASAIRWGMTFLVLSCGFGFALVVYGMARLDVGQAPDLVGRAGVPKFVHGIVLHALQILPAWVWALRLSGVGIHQRLASLRFAALGFCLLASYALWQTLNGYARFEPNPVGILLLSAVAACGVLATALSLHRFYPRNGNGKV